MTEDVLILSLEDRDRWIAEHADGGLPSQSWTYAWGLSASGVTPKLAVVRAAGARMLLPFIERDWNGSTDIATISGISGASIIPSSPAPLRLWQEFAAAQGWVAGYIQLAISTDLAGVFREGELVTNNTSFVLDLTQPSPLRSFSRTIRRKIRGAEASDAGLVHDRGSLLSALERLYPRTMRRVGAAAHFEYAAETLSRWLRDPCAVVLGGRLGGSIRAVYVFLTSGTHAESHILGYDDGGRDLIAWLIWMSLHELRERGVTELNLTGGMKPGDGLYRFKQGFRGTAVPRRAVHQVYDPVRYEELCRHAGVAMEADWFPAYRAARPILEAEIDPTEFQRTAPAAP